MGVIRLPAQARHAALCGPDRTWGGVVLATTSPSRAPYATTCWHTMAHRLQGWLAHALQGWVGTPLARLGGESAAKMARCGITLPVGECHFRPETRSVRVSGYLRGENAGESAAHAGASRGCNPAELRRLLAFSPDPPLPCLLCGHFRYFRYFRSRRISRRRLALGGEAAGARRAACVRAWGVGTGDRRGRRGCRPSSRSRAGRRARRHAG